MPLALENNCFKKADTANGIKLANLPYILRTLDNVWKTIVFRCQNKKQGRTVVSERSKQITGPIHYSGLEKNLAWRKIWILKKGKEFKKKMEVSLY